MWLVSSNQHFVEACFWCIPDSDLLGDSSTQLANLEEEEFVQFLLPVSSVSVRFDGESMKIKFQALLWILNWISVWGLT